MPGDMSSENRPNIDPSIASINSMGMEAARNFPQPESKAHVPDIRMELLDPREEALLRGRFGQERSVYERDPLGLYSAASNYTETLLKFNRLPEAGSAEHKAQIDQEVLRLSTNEKFRELGAAKISKYVENEMAKETAEVSAELDRNYRLAIASGNRSISETLIMLESFTPPKPFEANMQERRLQDGRQNLEAMATYFDSNIPEKIIGRYRAYDTISEQQIAHFNILCAAGGGLEGYYDALKQAGETLISRGRYHANVMDFRAAFTNDDPGVTTHELSSKEKTYTKDTLASKEIRETQVEMLSQARRLIMLNVDVSQLNMDKPVEEEGLMRLNPAKIRAKIEILEGKKGENGEPDKKGLIEELKEKGKNGEANRLQKHVDSLRLVENFNLKNHRELMQLVFGEIDKTKWLTWRSPDTGRVITSPKEILTWYASSDKVEDREQWSARMLAMLMWKKGDKNLSDFLETASETEVSATAKEILVDAENIRLNFNDKVMNSKLDFAAAKIALVSWIEQDKSFQTSGQLAWMFKYKEYDNPDGTKRVERLYDSGGLYKAFDSINLWGYWRRWTSYKAGLKSATTFFGPASDKWRREVIKHGPDWLPSLDRIDTNPKIKKLHDRFFDADPDHPNPEMRLWRAQRLTGNAKLTTQELDAMIRDGKIKEPSIDKYMQKELLKAGWVFGSAYDVPIPMYLPKTFKISSWETMVDKTTKETVWDLYRMGIMPKDVDWSVYNFESLDRHWVSMSMLTRFAHLFVDTYDEQRDPDFSKFFAEPGVQSIAEMAKRVYLAFRDLPEGYQQYIVKIVPFMIVQQTAKDTGLLSTDFGTPGSKEEVIKKWNYKMAEWIRAAMWTPEVILDDQQLYDGANADIQSMRNNIALMIEYYKHIFEKVAQAGFKSDFGKLTAHYRDEMELYKNSLAFEMSDAPGEASFDFGQGKISESFASSEKSVKRLLFGDRNG